MAKRSESEKKSPFDKTFVFMILFVNITSFVLISFFQSKSRSSSKPFETFDEFYPFYISQHADQVCRRLHFIGTSLIVLYSFFETHVITSMIMAAIMGYGVFACTKELDHGIVEMTAMLLTFLVFMRKLSGSWLKALAVPIVAYGFAWVGHFYFEMNKPATFIYPIFSLAGDFRLFGEILSRQREF
mmetsp:Transcript_36468/g.72568  ORF Transcript_36468/g.72568 Transcript_36468/m.72568 type:complete len:186 (+) Transcript_36468:71-628(+)